MSCKAWKFPDGHILQVLHEREEQVLQDELLELTEVLSPDDLKAKLDINF